MHTVTFINQHRTTTIKRRPDLRTLITTRYAQARAAERNF
jgi:hypothetical protein